jgi:hypothetical protein
MSSQNNKQRQHTATDQKPADEGNRVKDQEDWVTGDEPMTGAQASYLKTLSDETGEAFDGGLTKAEASKRIDELKRRDPRLKQK